MLFTFFFYGLLTFTVYFFNIILYYVHFNLSYNELYIAQNLLWLEQFCRDCKIEKNVHVTEDYFKGIYTFHCYIRRFYLNIKPKYRVNLSSYPSLWDISKYILVFAYISQVLSFFLISICLNWKTTP